ncbi:MAG: STAS domain-containing protein [Gammaproteobacteria bacterium]|nr:STAS domain-containing protein [Gammaproteobacteria bacterium]
MALSIKIDESKDTVKLVYLHGKLDSDTAPMLDQQLVSILQGNIKHLVFDMEGLSYISSAGLRSIFKAKKTIAASQGKIHLAHLKPHIKKVFEIINALPSFSVFASLEEMDDYFAAIQYQEMNK